MSYEDLVNKIDPDELQTARKLAFVTALRTVSDLCQTDAEFIKYISNRVTSVYRYMDETQWEIVYTMETGEDMPVYMAQFLGLETESI